MPKTRQKHAPQGRSLYRHLVLDLANGKMTAKEIAQSIYKSHGWDVEQNYIYKVVSQAGADYTLKKHVQTKSIKAKGSSNSFWTNENIERLLRYHREGDSASTIALRFQGRVTRNAVLGKLHRMGIAAVESKTTKRPVANQKFVTIKRARPKKNPRSKAPTPPPQTCSVLPYKVPKKERRRVLGKTSDGKVTADAGLKPDQCRWPIGDVDDADFYFCPLPKMPGQSYCQGHYTKSRHVPKPRERKKEPFLPPVKDNSKQFENV